jgi:hypothetical protein
MLELVGHPCAVNPDAKLRAHARKQGWRIRDYRTGRKAAVLGAKVVGAGATAAAAWRVSRRLRR